MHRYSALANARTPRAGNTRAKCSDDAQLLLRGQLPPEQFPPEGKRGHGRQVLADAMCEGPNVVGGGVSEGLYQGVRHEPSRVTETSPERLSAQRLAVPEPMTSSEDK